MKISCDHETRSPVDLKKAGAHVYFEHPETRVLMTAYRLDDGALKIWTYDQAAPIDLQDAIAGGAEINGWNVQFEALGFNLLADRFGWPRPRLEQYRDTAAAAAAMALPRALGDAAIALGLNVQKDKEGMRLIRLFSIPRKPRKGEPDSLYWNEPANHPVDWELFKSYCMRDVEVEEGVGRRIVPLSDDEQAMWVLTARINNRGIRVDRASARAAARLADKAKKVMDAEMREATSGAVTACSQVTRLVEWVASQGVDMASAGKAEILDLLELDDLPPQVRRALEIRQEAGKTSVSKLTALLTGSNSDGRIRGTGIYHAASTGREQSVRFNRNNLPRPRAIYEDAQLDRGALFRAFRSEDPELLTFLYGDALGRPLHLISDALRSFIWAAPGHDFVQADYSGIEGAVAAWVADEHWKVQALHDIIKDPSLPDMYRRTAAAIAGTTTDVITKKHPLRQSVGKVSELACFGHDTLVLTHRGPICIKAVKNTDLLWDGTEWVNHKGVVAKGVRQVVDVDGIAVTPDHLIRTGPRWRPAQELVSNSRALRQALATGSENLPSSATNTDLPAASATLERNARAEIRHGTIRRTSGAAQALGALSALRSLRIRREKSISATMTSYLMRTIATACWAASQLALTAATTLGTKPTRTTAGEASTSFGGKIAAPFSNIWLLLTVGISQNLISTGRTTIEATSPETFGSSRPQKIKLTSDSPSSCSGESVTSNKRSPAYETVYDIMNSGPRNCFTVFSRSGALIVHNCGFGGGVMAFSSMAKNYNVKLDPLFEPAWESSDEERRAKAIRRYESMSKRGKGGTADLSRNAWVACELIKVGWRATNPAIAKAWHIVEDGAREAIRNPGTQVVVLGGRITFLVRNGFLWMRLPSGRCLAYAAPRLKDQVWAKLKLPDATWSDPETIDREDAERGELAGRVLIQGNTSPRITILGTDASGRRMVREGLYSGLIFENLVQAIARDLLKNGMFAAEAAGYPIVFSVYDEVVTEVPFGWGDLDTFERLIAKLPEWAKTGPLPMPLTASGYRSKRYHK